VVEGADGFLKKVELGSVRCCDGVDKDHGKGGERRIKQDPISLVSLEAHNPFSVI
jgi:hypothetical protein